MKIQYASDLHLEFGSDPLRPEDMAGDVLVLAGDLHSKPARLAQWLAALPPRPTLQVLGNHEHYGGHFIQALDKYRQALAGLAHVRLLEQDEIHLGPVRFLGTSLWSALRDARGRMSPGIQTDSTDFRTIRAGSQYRRLQPADVIQRHQASRAWLETRLRIPHAGPTVVITHHAPSFKSAESADEDGSHCSDLDALILATRPDLWIHGHVHQSLDYHIGDTRVLCNPYGYLTRNAQDRNPAFDPRRWVAV
ncbi:metallophosphoesterase [Thermithiobacillus plumbiphilus]|uniref:Metallophosphoesterase n=1 Tax=Thermithiobacillus plumbiphilus TaxID=1729899 RepID=A0ABU9D8C2_9PROT